MLNGRRVRSADFVVRARSRLLRLFAGTTAALLLTSGASPASAYNNTLYQNTNGFDTCTAKTQAMLTAWWSGTPWYEIGVYLGGSVGQTLGCYDGTVAVDRALDTGYGVVLYWYGPQLGGACRIRDFSHYISLNTTTAYNQGVTEANSAEAAATAAGLPALTRIFYDMEAYYNHTGCRAAAKAFINGWDHQLAYYSIFWGAAYGSSCASYPSDWNTIADVPSEISPADTNPNITSGGLDNGSAFGYPCLSDSLWDSDQRVGQFSIDSDGTYNGVHFPIDENCADAYLPSPRGTTDRTCNDVL